MIADEADRVRASGLAAGDGLTLSHLVLIVWRYRWSVSAAFVLTLAAVMVVAFLLTPKYRSSVLLAPVEIGDVSGLSSLVSSQLGGLASLAGLGGGENSGKDEALALLTSRQFTTDFIRDNDLLPKLFADKWDDAAGSWRGDADADRPTLQDGFKLFNQSVRSVSVDRKTGLVTLSILWKDRHMAAEWAAAMVERVNEQLRQEAIAEAKLNIEFLERELENTSIIDLQTSIYELISSNINKVMLASTRDEFAFRIIDPPVVSDADKFVSPNYLLFALLGIVLGACVAGTVAYVRHLRALARHP